uniref:Protein sel-1 1 n=1 Tax=Lygus hesperus TaxID=30085 RepID=A0A0A9Z5Z6_LYGHE
MWSEFVGRSSCLLYMTLAVVMFNMIFLHAVVCQAEEKREDQEKSTGDKGTKPQEGSSEQVILRPLGVMANLRSHLQKTEHLLSNMLGDSPVMYSSRDKDDGAIEKIHDSVTNIQTRVESVDLQSHESESNLMYETALQVLNSQAKNKIPKAYELFEKASRLGHNSSRLKLAWGALLGDYKNDLEEATKTFVELADSGEPEAHMALGFLYSVGITVKPNQARALVHYMLSAIGGNIWAQTVLGYRYKSGITVASNCEKSLQFYEMAAKGVAKDISLFGGNLVHRIRLIDLEEAGGHNPYWLESDVLQYYEYLAAKGDLNAQVSLGQLYYLGLRGCPKDVGKAAHYFEMAAKKKNAVAMGYLGKIYLEDKESVKANNSPAFKLFKEAAEKNDPIGFSGLGLMYLEGRGVDVDLTKAKSYFVKAADLGWVEGQLQLGVMYMKGLGVTKDYRTAFKYFHLAAQHGNILAYYHLAQMHAAGFGILRSCPTAVELYKSVAERGKWNEYLLSGSSKYQSGRHFQAFVVYALLAELGYEVAQSNAAFILEKGLSGLKNMTEEEMYFRAFNYWRRAAQQGYSQAHVKLGDYYYYGHGVALDYEAAANQYRLASNQIGNPQALFNIGYMHEHGLGMPRDLSLAKRFYDLAAAVSPDALVPVYIALVKLAFIVALDSFFTQTPSLYTSLLEKWYSAPWDIYALVILFFALYLLVCRRFV